MSTILSIESLFEISIYISLVIFSVMGIIAVALCPYNEASNNIRLLLHRLMLVGVCAAQIVFKIYRKDSAISSSTVYQYPWILLILLIINLMVVNAPFLILNAIATSNIGETKMK